MVTRTIHQIWKATSIICEKIANILVKPKRSWQKIYCTSHSKVGFPMRSQSSMNARAFKTFNWFCVGVGPIRETIICEKNFHASRTFLMLLFFRRISGGIFWICWISQSVRFLAQLEKSCECWGIAVSVGFIAVFWHYLLLVRCSSSMKNESDETKESKQKISFVSQYLIS